MARGARNKKIEATEAAQILDTVKSLDTKTVISEVNDLQVLVQGTLANVGASITNKVAQVETLDKAISLKEGRLKELYEIEADAIKWDDIKAQHEAEKVFWEREKEEHERNIEDEDRQRQQERTRLEEEWRYNYSQRQARAEADLKQQVENARKDESRRQEELLRSWAEKEAALQARAQELVDLKTRVEGIPSEISSAVSKAEAILKNVLEKQVKHELALLQKDIETTKALAQAQLQSANATIASQNEQLDDLKQQLLRALADAKDVAQRALEASSDRKVAEALRQVVDNRDQPQQGSKR